MEYIRTFTVEFETGNHAELSVEGRAGSIGVRGDDTNTVRVEVVARLWGESEDEADDQLELVRRNIRHDGQRVSIRAPSLPRPSLLLFGRGPRVEYQLTVPRATAATIASRSGRIEVERLMRDLNIESRSGRVMLRDIAGDVRVSSASGSMQSEGIGGSFSVESRSGGVRVAGCRGDVDVSVRSGSLQIEDVGGSVRADSRSGSTSVSEVGGALTLRSKSGSVRYEGPVGGPFDIEVMSGSVRLSLDPDSAFMLDASTMSGSVRSDFPVRRSAPTESGRSAPTVRVRAMSGSIYLGRR